MPVYQQNGRWYFKIQIRGKRYNRAVPEATSKTKAEQAEAVFKGELLQGRYNLAENKGELLFEKLAEIYLDYSKTTKLSYKSDVSTLKKLQAFFNGKRLNEISPILIESYRSMRKKQKKGSGEKAKTLKNSTINREVEVLRKMLNIAIDNNWLDNNPCSSKRIRPLREDRNRERFLNPEEEATLIEKCVGEFSYMRPIIITALNTAMRKGEILNLTWKNVNLDRNFITVTKTKSGQDRYIPISPILRKELLQLNKNVISDYVFTNPETKNPYHDLKRSFPSICKKAEIEGIVFHDLRHTAATRMVACGVDLVTVKDILGHSDIKTTMRYSHPVPENKLEAIKKLSEYSKQNQKSEKVINLR